MRIHAFRLQFIRAPSLTKPADAELHKLAQEFCLKNLRDRVSLADYGEVFVTAKVDENYKPIEVTGVMCLATRLDVPVIRFLDAKSGSTLLKRVMDFAADQGLRGTEAFVFISETEAAETRCPFWKVWLERFKAKPAERFSVVIR